MLNRLSNGQLREYLAAGITQDELKQRLKAALTDQTTATASRAAQVPSNPPSQQPVPTSTQHPPTTQATTQTSAPAETTATNSTVRNLLQDRRDRLEADKKRQDAAERANRQAKAKARRDEAESQATAASPGSSRSHELSYAQQQRKRQQDARQERERIMRQIEADKADRREREERRRALSRAEAAVKASSSDGANGLVDRQLSSEEARRQASTQPSSSKDCAVQVRLLDGSTIRSRFPSDHTLRTHVRAWVDGQRSDGDVPYTFKQILAPKPNRAITISEEEESLQSLGLTPSATLVMVPVQGSIAAYGSGGPGLLSRGLSVGYGLVSGGVDLVTGALGAVLGVGQAPQQASAASAPAPGDIRSLHATPPSTAGGISVRTLRDQQAAGDDHQFYNGNQVSHRHVAR